MSKKIISMMVILTMLMLVFMASCKPASSDQTLPANDKPSNNDATSNSEQENAAKDSDWKYEMGGPVSEEPVTIKILTHTGHAATMMPADSELPIYAAIQERLGINIEWETLDNKTYGELVNVRLMSTDLPDMVVLMDMNIIGRLVKEDFFWAYDDLGEENMPYSKIQFEDPEFSDLEPIYRSLFGDGKIYGFGCTVLKRFLGLNAWLHTIWLKKLDLEEPTTVDEFLNVLRAFRDEDPNENGQQDEIPFVDLGGLPVFLGAVFDLNFYYGWNLDKDGKVLYQYASPTYFDYLKVRKQMFDEDLIDKENRDINSVYELVASDSVGGIGYWATFQGGVNQKSPHYEDNSKPVFLELLPLENAYTGERWRFSRPSSGVGEGMYILKETDHPEVCLRVADWLWASEEYKMLMNYGIEGETFEYNENGEPVEIIPDDWDVSKGSYLTSIGGNQPPFAHPQWEYAWRMKRLAEGFTTIIERADELQPYYRDGMPPLVLTADENEEFNKYMPDVNTYRAEMEANFIEGRVELTQENFDAYVEELYTIGLTEATEIMQNKYDSIYGQ